MSLQFGGGGVNGNLNGNNTKSELSPLQTYRMLIEKLERRQPELGSLSEQLVQSQLQPDMYPADTVADLRAQHKAVKADVKNLRACAEYAANSPDVIAYLRKKAGGNGAANGSAPKPRVAFADDAREKGQHEGIYNATTLKHHEFPPQPEAVEDLVPVGLSLIAGPPKLGKSFWVLNVSCAVQSGGKALSRFDVSKGDVLYLALEDSKRRMQKRLLSVLGDYDDWPGHMPDIAHEVPGGWENLLPYLTTWLDNHKKARLIVIDTLAKLKPSRKRHDDPYQHDYAIAAKLQTLALERGIALLIVHHTKKGPEEDFISAVSGTHGITGACDAVMVLKRKRGEPEGTLSITGRDVEERDLAMKFTGEDWACLGDATEVKRSESRQKILDALRAGPLTPVQIAAAADMPRGRVRKLLFKMLDKAEVRKDGETYSVKI